MGKEVREISRFFVASPRVFPLYVWRVSRTSLPTIIHPFVHVNVVVSESPSSHRPAKPRQGSFFMILNSQVGAHAAHMQTT